MMNVPNLNEFITSNYPAMLQTLREELSALREQIGTLHEQLNRRDTVWEAPVRRTAGSMRNEGEELYLTPDQVRAMDAGQVRREYARIRESMKYWG